jgi:MinD-like ATPase involved in chromosome partitioning or flagellar assembly
MANTITFHSFKGGSGRSVLLANVSAYLAGLGYRVVCIDFDLEAGGLHQVFHVNKERIGLNILDYLTANNPPPLDQIVMDISQDFAIEEPGKLYLIPAISVINQLTEIHQNQIEILQKLHEIVEEISESYNPHFIMIDLKAGFTDFSLQPYQNLANAAIVVLRSNRQNVEGVGLLFSALRQLRYQPVYHVVLSQFPNVADSDVIIDQLAHRLGEVILGRGLRFGEVVPYNPRLALEESVISIDQNVPLEEKKPYLNIGKWLVETFNLADRTRG